MFDPHAATVPSEHTATEMNLPAATPTTVLPASPPVMLTATGTELPTVLPFPSWPESLMPHATTVPSEHAATLWPSPAATATTVFPAKAPVIGTATGTVLANASEPFPSWPPKLAPQVAKVPSEQSATLKNDPVATETTVFPTSAPLRGTATGTALDWVLPFPY